LDGGAGNDTFLAQSGSDAFNGGDGLDIVSFAGSSAGVRAYMDPGRAFRNRGDAAGDTYASIEGFEGSDFDDALFGHGPTDSTLNGGTGDDALVGAEGNDTIIGGAGNEFLYGGAGNDTFVFRVNDGADFIFDFDRDYGDGSTDVIELLGGPASDFSSLQSYFVDGAKGSTGTTIDFGNGDSIALAGVSIDDLSAEHFVFA
ncbi:unnamed protein product, partial [Ectocarpus sp. 13 AM-2016]